MTIVAKLKRNSMCDGVRTAAIFSAKLKITSFMTANGRYWSIARHLRKEKAL